MTDRKPEELREFFTTEEDGGPLAADVSALLYRVADGGGVAEVETLTANGVPGWALAAALRQPDGDKRARPPLRGYNISGAWVVVLTSAGWTAVGQPNRREQRPNAHTLPHTLAPGRIARHLAAAAAPFAEQVRISVRVDASALLDWSAGVSAAAWSRITGGTATDQSGSVGTLTRPEAVPRPDALVYEEWREGWPAPTGAPWGNTPDHAPAAWLAAATSPGQPAPFVSLVHVLEVETSSKPTDALRAKVQRLNTVMDLGAADTVVWVVDDSDTAARVWAAVRSENTGRPDPRHRFVPLAWATSSTPNLAAGHVLPLSSLCWWLPDYAQTLRPEYPTGPGQA